MFFHSKKLDYNLNFNVNIITICNTKSMRIFIIIHRTVSLKNSETLN